MDFVDGAVAVDVEGDAGEGGGEFCLQAADDVRLEFFLLRGGNSVEGGDAGLDDVAGAVARAEKGKRVSRLASIVIENDELTAWLVEAALRYAHKPLAISSLQSQPVLFPFSLTRPLAYLASNSEHLAIRSEGASNQFVALRSEI